MPIPHLDLKLPPVVQPPPPPEWPPLSAAEKDALRSRIKRLLKEQDALLVAHYYVDGDLQALAEETGGCVTCRKRAKLC